MQQAEEMPWGDAIENPLPYIERGVLACMMETPGLWELGKTILNDAAFTVLQHRQIWNAMKEVDGDEVAPDLTTVYTKLVEHGVAPSTTGLWDVMDTWTLVHKQSFQWYIERILAAWEARETQHILARMTAEAEGAALPLQSVSERLAALGAEFAMKKPMEVTTIGHDAAAFVESLGKASSHIPTRYTLLDRLLGGGFEPGEFVVIGGRPGMGKSTFALNLVEGFIEPSCYISMEMNREKVGRLSTMITFGVEMRDLVTYPEQKAPLLQAMREPGGRVYTLYPTQMTPATLGMTAKRLRDQHGVRILVVDNLNLISEPISRRLGRVQELTAITREIKMLALNLGIVIICIAHLNRLAEKRDDPRPVLTDLRDSGSVEQDADVVLFLYRDDYQQAAGTRRPGPTELILRKGRMRNLGTVPFAFDPKTQRYTEARDV